MRARGRLDRWMCGLAALVAMGGMAMVPTPALAQDGAAVTEEGGVGRVIVERCLGEMREAVRKTADAIGSGVDRTVEQLGVLAENGAPETALIRVGGKGIALVDGWARRGHERINGIATRCSRMLTKAGAPPVAFEVVREGAARSHEAIAGFAQAGRRAIGDALEEALDGGEDEDEAPAPE